MIYLIYHLVCVLNHLIYISMLSYIKVRYKRVYLQKVQQNQQFISQHQDLQKVRMFNIHYPTLIREKAPEKPVVQKLRSYACELGSSAEFVFQNIHRISELRAKNIDKKYSFEFLKFKHVNTQSNVCAKILPKKTKGNHLMSQKAFKCHDCIFENNSIMCTSCFEDSEHKGHIYEVVQVFGGCCDCGDEQKWNPVGFCKQHNNRNLVHEMQQQVDKDQQLKFLQHLAYCFVYYFILYDQAQNLRKHQSPAEQISQQLKRMYEQSSCFGRSLIQYLCEFNKDSLISNIMTFNLFRYRVPLKRFQLGFCATAESINILEINFHILKLRGCSEKMVDLFTQLFTLRQFRRQLTITFMRLHHSNPQFAMGDYNHLTCQLLTSHKMIRQLVQSKEIQPLVYKPKKKQVDSFVDMAKNLLRYYIDIDYLSRLYKDTPEKYMCYHIMEGQLVSIGYYREFVSRFQDAIDYYGIQQVGLSKVIAIMSIIKKSPQCLSVLQQGMTDLWRQSFRLYAQQQQVNSIHSMLIDQPYYRKNIYITYELQLGLLMFTYVEKLQEQMMDYYNDEQICRALIKILGLQGDNAQAIQKLLKMLQVVNSNMIYAGLALGHSQTMQLHYTFYSYTFKKSLSIISLTFYLYKMLTKIINFIKNKHNGNEQLQQPQNKAIAGDNICRQKKFRAPLDDVKAVLNGEDFKDDHESIFDRKKILIKLTYFLHLLIQASQTDIHELIIASLIGFTDKEKYQTKLHKFYLQLLKNYNKVTVKQFKQIADSLFVNNEAFERFISSSKQVIIEHGKISLKSVKQSQLLKQIQQTKSKQQQVKTQSELNLFYFKSLKNKLINLNEKDIAFKTPQSTNHFLHQILSQDFVCELLQLLSGYIDMLVMVDGKIKAQESGTLGLLVIEMIKIGKAFAHKKDSKISEMILGYFKNLQQKKSNLYIFHDDLIKIICSQSQQSHMKIGDSMKSLNESAQLKAEERKKKLQEKKKKMKAKFKQNQEKFEQAYGNELKKIRDEIEDEQEMQQQQEQSQQQIKACIICRQGEEKQKFKLMCFMQLSDLYEQTIKGKDKSSFNCHIVFKTCGHFIHEKCYKKTIKNDLQEYSMCELCKSTVNCLFPICLESQQMSQKQNSKDKNKLLEKELVSLQNQELYQNLKATFSVLFAIDSGLREDCENGFSQILMDDDKEIKIKLLESIVSQIVFSAVICQQSNQRTFTSKQLNIYRNILHALRIFDAGEQKENRLSKGNKQKTLPQHIFDMISHNQEDMESRIEKQQNQERKKVLQIAYNMENYVLVGLHDFFSAQKQPLSFQNKTLSKECIKIIDSVMQKLTSTNNSVHEKTEVQEKKQQVSIKFSDCPQSNLLNKQIKFYNPPQSLQQLIKMRGKCPNCGKFTNFISICIICEWKGCKGCEKESLFDHTRNKHCGNSIYLDINVGNIYFVSRKKFWQYGSIYQDYLGERLQTYEIGVKLQRYTLNEHHYEKLKKAPLMYNVESTIRYEEYSKKRHFIGNI